MLLGIIDIVKTFFKNIATRLQLPSVIFAVVFAVVGLAFVFLAKRIARAVRKTNDIKDNDRVYITFKVIGLTMLFISLLIIVFSNLNNF